MPTPLEFVVFHYRNNSVNTSENSFDIYYLQWTGNEKSLSLLNTIITNAEYDDDYYEQQCYLNIDVKVPLPVVDMHCALNDVQYPFASLSKCTGTFDCPFKEDDIDLDGDELYCLIDKYFEFGQIDKMFRE